MTFRCELFTLQIKATFYQQLSAPTPLSSFQRRSCLVMLKKFNFHSLIVLSFPFPPTSRKRFVLILAINSICTELYGEKNETKRDIALELNLLCWLFIFLICSEFVFPCSGGRETSMVARFNLFVIRNAEKVLAVKEMKRSEKGSVLRKFLCGLLVVRNVKHKTSPMSKQILTVSMD